MLSPMRRAFRMRQRLVVGLLLSTTAGTWVVPDASAKIVVGQGIAGVKLGESEAQVRKQLGKPRYVQPPGWGYGNPLGGWVGFDFQQRVNDIWTTSRRQRTNRGIGPGASVRAARRAYPKARCYRHAGRWSLLCIIKSHRHGNVTETDFFFTSRLAQVDIFLVPPVPKRQPA
jgi:hypothetical protein